MLIDCGTDVLDNIVAARHAEDEELKEVAPVQRTVHTATNILRSIEPPHREDEAVQDLVLALGVAVERLVALEDSGVTP